MVDEESINKNNLASNQQMLQQKYIDYQLLEEQLKKLEEQLNTISDNILELKYIHNSIGEISELEKDKTILCPVSNGIFIKAKIIDSKVFYVNVGNNIVVKKNIEESKKLIDLQKQEMTNSKETLLDNIHNLNEKLVELEQELMNY
ncbi:MAG: prefoldin subunit alpha [Nanoarchaeota archaeon]